MSRFVCGTENEKFLAWLKGDHAKAVAEKDERTAFIQKQVEAATAAWRRHWERLFLDLQEAGAIDPGLRFEDCGLSLSIDEGKPTQLFMRKLDESPAGLLRKLLDTM